MVVTALVGSSGCSVLSPTPKQLTVFNDSEAALAARVAAQVMIKSQSWQPKEDGSITPAQYELEPQTHTESCIASGWRETWWDPGKVYANPYGEPFPGESTTIERSADECQWFAGQSEHGWMKVEIGSGVIDPDELTPLLASDMDTHGTDITYTYDDYWQKSVNGYRGCLNGRIRVQADNEDGPLTARSQQMELCDHPSIWLEDVEIELTQGQRVGRWQYINAEQFRRLEVEVRPRGNDRGARVSITGAEDVSMEITLNAGRVTSSRWMSPEPQQPGKGGESGRE